MVDQTKNRTGVCVPATKIFITPSDALKMKSSCTVEFRRPDAAIFSFIKIAFYIKLSYLNLFNVLWNDMYN